MPANCLKGFFAQIVLYFACIRSGDINGNAKRDKIIRKQLMALIYVYGDFLSFFRQRYPAILVHNNIAIFPQKLCRKEYLSFLT